MTGKTFKRRVVATIATLFGVTSLVLAMGIHWVVLEKQSIAAVPMLIALAAGWLTYSLQRRVSYINSLRALWVRVIESVQNAIQYTYHVRPLESEFSDVVKNLRSRIEDVRGVFRNVGEDDIHPTDQAKEYVRAVRHAKSLKDLVALNRGFAPTRGHIGVYPFESLKQIHATIEKLGYGEAVTSEKSDIARDTIWHLWRIMRAELAKELDRDFPEFPDTPYARRR
jgi:hypothetical protein